MFMISFEVSHWKNPPPAAKYLFYPCRYGRIVERILDRNTSSRKDDAERLLRWLACVKRPLKWYEFQATVCVNLEDVDYNAESFLRRKWLQTPKDICGALVEHHHDQTVEFVHPTARE